MKMLKILYTKQNEPGSWNKIFCLTQGSEINDFCRNKQGHGLKALVAISTLQTSFERSPPLGEDYIAEGAISVFLICANGDTYKK